MNRYTSMSYKHVAPNYNAINALPPLAASQIGDAIARSTYGGHVLDLGAGAGRLSIPAAWAGCNVIALDLEMAMLRAGRAEGRSVLVNVPAVQASALHLPFPNHSFETVMINNVLHQVPEWESALDEVVRVLRPCGVLLQGRDWLDPQSCAGRIRSKWREIVGTLDPEMRPTSAAGPALFQTLARMGGKFEREIAVAEWTECMSPAHILDRMRARQHNETWSLSDDVLNAGLPMLTEWAQTQWVDVREEEQVHWRFMLSVTRGLN
jgi:SAM-dependent methyltransferase